MKINQFRRDPISGQWCIILCDDFDIEQLVKGGNERRDDAVASTKYSSGNESQTLPEIFAIRADNSAPNSADWQVRVIPVSQPFLQIYGDLNNRGVGLYDVLDGIGAHELVIESPRPNIQMQEMDSQQVHNILYAYRTRILDLKRDMRFRYIMVHKHYGEGDQELRAHSHSHIIATPITPTRVKVELVNAMEHYKHKERCLFCDVIFQELTDKERVVVENEHFLALAPFASRSPFSMWIMPKAHETFFENNSHYEALTDILMAVLRKLRSVLNNPNYIMVLHTGPNITTGKPRGYWRTIEKDYHWYIDITPRFRTYTSFDIGSGFQVNPVSPEAAAEILRTEQIKSNASQP